MYFWSAIILQAIATREGVILIAWLESGRNFFPLNGENCLLPHRVFLPSSGSTCRKQAELDGRMSFFSLTNYVSMLSGDTIKLHFNSTVQLIKPTACLAKKKNKLSHNYIDGKIKMVWLLVYRDVILLVHSEEDKKQTNCEVEANFPHLRGIKNSFLTPIRQSGELHGSTTPL